MISSQVVEYAATGRVIIAFTLTSLIWHQVTIIWHQVTTEEYAMGTICYQNECKRALLLLPSGKKTHVAAGPNTSAFSSSVWRRPHQPWHTDQRRWWRWHSPLLLLIPFSWESSGKGICWHADELTAAFYELPVLNIVYALSSCFYLRFCINFSSVLVWPFQTRVSRVFETRGGNVWWHCWTPSLSMEGRVSPGNPLPCQGRLLKY